MWSNRYEAAVNEKNKNKTKVELSLWENKRKACA